ncbi:Alginate lyase 2 [Elaphomyces granulatus]
MSSMRGLLAFCLLWHGVFSVDPKCAPGGNFDLSHWELQLPSASPQKPGVPQTISSSQLRGCNGFHDQFFFTDQSTGAMAMGVPGSPASTHCVTTAHSQYCRTELREVDASGKLFNWSPNAPTNRLTVELAVMTAASGALGTVVGQVHMDDSISTKPVCELYYQSNGNLGVGVQKSRTGSQSRPLTVVGNVPVGRKFSYSLQYERGALSVSINNGAPHKLDVSALNSPQSYFKAGNYNNGDSASLVHFYSISIQHG